MHTLRPFFVRMTCSHFQAKWNHWLKELESSRQFYGHRVEVAPRAHVPRPDTSTQVVPALVVLVFGLRGLLFLLVGRHLPTPLHRLYLFIGVVPGFAQKLVDRLFVAWACLQLLTIAFESTRPLHCFQHLALIIIKPGGAIEPQDVGLTNQQYLRFDRFRALALSVLWYQTSFISWLATIVVIISAAIEHSFELSWPSVLAWLPIFLLYVYYICYAAYAVPVLFLILVRYLRLKQTANLQRLNIIEDMARNLVHKSVGLPRLSLGKSKAMLVNMFLRNVQLQTELDAEIAYYNKHFWSYYLSCFCLIFNILITYLTYLIYFQENVPLYGHVIFDIVWLAHVVFMGLVIVAGAVVARGHREYQQKMRNFSHLCFSTMINRFDSRTLLKVCNNFRLSDDCETNQMSCPQLESLVANELGRTNGFYLVNNYHIDSVTLITVVKYISTFFFLVFA